MIKAIVVLVFIVSGVTSDGQPKREGAAQQFPTMAACQAAKTHVFATAASVPEIEQAGAECVAVKLKTVVHPLAPAQ